MCERRRDACAQQFACECTIHVVVVAPERSFAMVSRACARTRQSRLCPPPLNRRPLSASRASSIHKPSVRARARAQWAQRGCGAAGAQQRKHQQYFRVFAGARASATALCTYYSASHKYIRTNISRDTTRARYGRTHCRLFDCGFAPRARARSVFAILLCVFRYTHAHTQTPHRIAQKPFSPLTLSPLPRLKTNKKVDLMTNHILSLLSTFHVHTSRT